MKTMITVYIDGELVNEARLKKVKFSELMSNSLKTYLDMDEDMSEDMSLNDKIVTAKARVMSLESEQKKKKELKVKKEKENKRVWITR